VEANQKQVQFSEALDKMLDDNALIKLKFIPISRENFDFMSRKQSNFLFRDLSKFLEQLSHDFRNNKLDDDQFSDNKLRRAKEFYATV
jgi:hypothetical protein